MYNNVELKAFEKKLKKLQKECESYSSEDEENKDDNNQE